MQDIEQLEKDILKIKQRNRRVEQDKAWEVSKTRKILIATLTYSIIVLFFYVIHVGNPWLSAVVPTLGFLLSTLSIPLVKKHWIQKSEKT
jgi:polyferredoxin